MFSGIVDHQGQIRSIEKNSSSSKIWIASHFDHDVDEFSLGESIAIDGVCLTVTEYQENNFACDVSSETLQCTIMGYYQLGQAVNLERALRLQDRMGGHFVTGHVDQTVKIAKISKQQEFVEITFDHIHPGNRPFIVAKGCVAINGVSLTVNQIFENGFNVMLIPHTLARTNLSQLTPGDLVNIEFDYHAKLMHEQIKNYFERSTLFNKLFESAL